MDLLNENEEGATGDVTIPSPPIVLRIKVVGEGGVGETVPGTLEFIQGMETPLPAPAAPPPPPGAVRGGLPPLRLVPVVPTRLKVPDDAGMTGLPCPGRVVGSRSTTKGLS